jgi:hypothetical protein
MDYLWIEFVVCVSCGLGVGTGGKSEEIKEVFGAHPLPPEGVPVRQERNFKFGEMEILMFILINLSSYEMFLLCFCSPSA